MRRRTQKGADAFKRAQDSQFPAAFLIARAVETYGIKVQSSESAVAKDLQISICEESRSNDFGGYNAKAFTRKAFKSGEDASAAQLLNEDVKEIFGPKQYYCDMIISHNRLY